METNIREYGEGLPVLIDTSVEARNRLVVIASNQAGYDSVEIDLGDIVDWVKEYIPELLMDERTLRRMDNIRKTVEDRLARIDEVHKEAGKSKHVFKTP